MKVLVTGFDPFGGEAVNPAFEAVKLLPCEIAGAEIIKLEIPTVFSKCGPAVEAGIQKYEPDIVINVGQAGGRSCVTIEQVAVNLAEARIPDNDGEQPSGEPVQKDGAPAYYPTIPVKAIVKGTTGFHAISLTRRERMCATASCTTYYIWPRRSIPISGQDLSMFRLRPSRR